jgi:hypothetical protein
MKTAMQELIDELNNIRRNTPYTENLVQSFYKSIIGKASLKLEKEKEQIKDAWDAGMSEGIGTTMGDLDWDGEFINYYNETYTK